MRCLYLALINLALASCDLAPQPCHTAPKGDVVYVVGHGWHAELGIPVQELDSDMTFYRGVFSGARVIMFGYGKRTFLTAPPDTPSEYLLGPFPGPAAIQAVGLSVTPDEAYSTGDTVTLALPQGGAKALSAYIWKDLVKDGTGKPQMIAHSSNPDGLFYAARSRYTLAHTCNTWTADALHEAGLPVSGNAVVFSGQVMSRAQEAAQNQCPRVTP